MGPRMGAGVSGEIGNHGRLCANVIRAHTLATGIEKERMRIDLQRARDDQRGLSRSAEGGPHHARI